MEPRPANPSQFERSGQICRTVFVRQREGLFFIRLNLSVFVVGDVAAGRLRSQPLAHVAFVGLVWRQVRQRSWLRRQGLVQAQLFSDHDHSGVNGGAEIAYELTDKNIQFVHVNCRNLCCVSFDISFFELCCLRFSCLVLRRLLRSDGRRAKKPPSARFTTLTWAQTLALTLECWYCAVNDAHETSGFQFVNAPFGLSFHAQTCSV